MILVDGDPTKDIRDIRQNHDRDQRWKSLRSGGDRERARHRAARRGREAALIQLSPPLLHHEEAAAQDGHENQNAADDRPRSRAFA